ncbi:MAG: class I SAM-dependent methyltransferase [Lentisphaeria bacterium]|nr:class I SAM-dependent methyltransferase [Lentisphaeria bacterium]
MARASLYDRMARAYEELFPVRSDFITLLTELVPAGARVLDVACGPGHYARALSDRYDMSATDINVSMIKSAAAHGKVSFHTRGFAEIAAIPGPFACVYSIGNSLSYLPTDQLPTFLESARKILLPDGLLLLHTVNWDAFLRTGKMEFEEKTLMDGTRFRRAYEKVNAGIVLFHTWLETGNESCHWQDPLHPKPSAAVSARLRETGFTVEKHFGAYDKTPFNSHGSPVSIFVARKPSE